MGYVVTRAVGFTDAEFWEYVRLLRQRGIDIGRLPRVLDPQTGKRWLYVWTDREAAKDFADELNQGVPDAPWEVTETDAPPSIGPVGPIIIQMVRRSDGVMFALDPLSRAILRSVFPAAVGITTYPSIDLAVWADAAKRSGGRQGLVERILPNLTGLSGDQLEGVGYSVIDVDSEQTILKVGPAAAVQV